MSGARANVTAVNVGDEIAHCWWTLCLAERRALSALAYVDLGAEVDSIKWHELTGDQRDRLMAAMRRTAELAMTCAAAMERQRQLVVRR